MKKIGILVLIVLILGALTSCDKISGLFMREYDGEPITEITYETVDYMGGYTKTFKIDFMENKVYKKEYYPYLDDSEYLDEETLSSDMYKNNNKLALINTFTDDEEKSFIDSCYSYRLFSIKEEYSNNFVMDGGGWSLDITYEDGNVKRSKGSNASPQLVFNMCAVPFYDLCGERVLGSLPDYFLSPPNISVSTVYSYGSTTVHTNEGIDIERADYYWSGGRFSSSDKDLYAINEDYSSCNLPTDTAVSIVFYTSNFRDYKRFSRFVFKSYDYNEELTNETVITEKRWFKQIEFELERDKIYVYELYFTNGEYVRYTFNTKTEN